MAKPSGYGDAAAGVVSVKWWGRYVGLPFGDGPGQVTCWGLVRRVYADHGIALPSYGEISARDLVRVARAMRDGAAAEAWATPQEPADRDIVLMSNPRAGSRVVGHVGLFVAPFAVLHVEALTKTHVASLAHPAVAGRVLGYRRHVG